MVVDALTKPMISDILYDLLTTGYWRVEVQCITKKCLVAVQRLITDYDESTLMQMPNDRPEYALSPACRLVFFAEDRHGASGHTHNITDQAIDILDFNILVGSISLRNKAEDHRSKS